MGEKNRGRISGLTNIFLPFILDLLWDETILTKTSSNISFGLCSGELGQCDHYLFGCDQELLVIFCNTFY